MIKDFALSVVSQITPKNGKIALYYFLNFCFLGFAIMGYVQEMRVFKVLGLLYVVVCGIAVFAGLNNLE